MHKYLLGYIEYNGNRVHANVHVGPLPYHHTSHIFFKIGDMPTSNLKTKTIYKHERVTFSEIKLIVYII